MSGKQVIFIFYHPKDEKLIKKIRSLMLPNLFILNNDQVFHPDVNHRFAARWSIRIVYKDGNSQSYELRWLF